MQALISPPSSALTLERTGTERVIPVAGALIDATLSVPVVAKTIIVLPHASSASRFEPAQRFLGQVFEQAGMATLQADLLTPQEEASLPIDQYRHQDAALLTQRLLGVLDWLKEQPMTAHLRLGLFAATRETVPAMIAAERSGRAGAVVSEGGWPDFFDERLTVLKVPTLLIVGRKERERAAEIASEFFARTLGS